MIEFETTTYHDIIDEMKESFIEDHNEEVGHFEGTRKLDPDYDSYEALADTDQLAVFAAREDGKLVGYAWFLLTYDMYHRTLLMGISDLIYLAPEYRGPDSMEFIQYCEDKLYSDFGVDGINISMHTSRDFSGMLEHMDYHKSAIVCSKYIGDD